MNESQYHRFGNPSRVRITWDWYNAFRAMIYKVFMLFLPIFGKKCLFLSKFLELIEGYKQCARQIHICPWRLFGTVYLSILIIFKNRCHGKWHVCNDISKRRLWYLNLRTFLMSSLEAENFLKSKFLFLRLN